MGLVAGFPSVAKGRNPGLARRDPAGRAQARREVVGFGKGHGIGKNYLGSPRQSETHPRLQSKNHRLRTGTGSLGTGILVHDGVGSHWNFRSGWRDARRFCRFARRRRSDAIVAIPRSKKSGVDLARLDRAIGRSRTPPRQRRSDYRRIGIRRRTRFLSRGLGSLSSQSCLRPAAVRARSQRKPPACNRSAGPARWISQPRQALSRWGGNRGDRHDGNDLTLS